MIPDARISVFDPGFICGPRNSRFGTATMKTSIARRQVLECIAAGKHVHLDKPAGDSMTQYRKLLDAAAKKNLLVQMGYMYRYSPAVVLLRQFLKDGWLGDVFEVHTVMSKVVGDAERKNLAQFPGGIMFELGCHVIDQVIAVLGKPDRVHAFPRHSGK